MTEQELARSSEMSSPGRAAGRVHGGPDPRRRKADAATASHAVFPLAAGADDDGVCIIEPAVACNHCGFCKSLGH